MVVIPASARAAPSVEELVAVGRAAGLAAVGVASAEPFESTRRDLEERKAWGLHGGMAFTYRNPARSTDPGRALPGARALVVGAWSYLRTEPAAQGRPKGVVARYARDDYYGQLRDALQRVAERLTDDGWRARVLADDNALVDRAVAQRAGLGWYGKNANLLLPGQGSWFVLGAVVTDAPLATTTPDDQVPDGCGTCTRCLDGCPTGAIVAPGVVDARRCLAWLLQVDGPFPRRYRIALGDRIYGCDDCQEVCPPNRRQVRHQVRPTERLERAYEGTAELPPEVGVLAPETGARRGELAKPVSEVDAVTTSATGTIGEPFVDLVGLLGLSDVELLARYGRWYIPRREPRYLRRNALVVLGNVGDPGDAATVDAVRRALRDADPLVRAHAVWAARRMGHDELCEALADDPDPLVREELLAKVEVRTA